MCITLAHTSQSHEGCSAVNLASLVLPNTRQDTALPPSTHQPLHKCQLQHAGNRIWKRKPTAGAVTFLLAAMQKSLRKKGFLKSKRLTKIFANWVCCISCSDCFAPFWAQQTGCLQNIQLKAEDKCHMQAAAAVRCRDTNTIFKMFLLCVWISVWKCKHHTLQLQFMLFHD